MQLQNNWMWNIKKHNLWMGEILKQHTIIVHKQITDRPLTDICKKVFLSPCYFFYVAFFSRCTTFMLHFPMLHCFHVAVQLALYSYGTFSMFHSFHNALFPCRTFVLMQFFKFEFVLLALIWCPTFFRLENFSYCMIFILHSFHEPLFLCCTFLLLHSLLLHFFQVSLFHVLCCTSSCGTFSCCTVFYHVSLFPNVLFSCCISQKH